MIDADWSTPLVYGYLATFVKNPSGVVNYQARKYQSALYVYKILIPVYIRVLCCTTGQDVVLAWLAQSVFLTIFPLENDSAIRGSKSDVLDELCTIVYTEKWILV